jgi:RNA polymerase sigma factor (sigma-70 family)
MPPHLGQVVGHIRKLAALQATKERTDQHLLQEFVCHRNQAAFAALLQRHGAMVLAVCRQVLGHAQDAEDAFQGTFLVLARNAASVRKAEALASWLHGVAYRISMKAKRDAARRLAKESRLRSLSPKNPNPDVAWREMQALLHQEIERLPEIYRAPFVLCFLEDKSRAEVASLLLLNQGTVSSRLAKARRRLRQRLQARGVALSALLASAALSAETARGIVPGALVDATVRAALGYLDAGSLGKAIASSKAVALADAITRTIALTKIKLASVLVLAAGLVAGGAGLFTQRAVAVPKQPLEATLVPQSMIAEKMDPALDRLGRKSSDGAAKPPAPGLVVRGDALTISGRVLDPDGRPLAGAELALAWWHGIQHVPWWPPTVHPFRPGSGAVSGPDGRFRFTVTKAELYSVVDDDFDQIGPGLYLVASAQNCGPAWVSLARGRDGEFTMSLARDDVPIQGRVLDLAGEPVAGASVRLEFLTSGTSHLFADAWAGLSSNVTTDQQGRFVFAGVGRDRTVHLRVQGLGIECKIAAVSTAAVANGRLVGTARVDVAVGPTKPIAGTVRELGSGKPLAGIVVYGNYEKRGEVRAITDQNGRYLLLGLPKAPEYVLRIYPRGDQEYLAAGRVVADTAGLQPASADFNLRRGIPVRVRIIDRQTGQAVRGDLIYSPLARNPLIAEANFTPPGRYNFEFDHTRTPGKDNVTRLVVYPGPGIIIARVCFGRIAYAAARIDAAARKAAEGDPSVNFIRIAANGYRIINPPANSKPLTIDIPVDPVARTSQ